MKRLFFLLLVIISFSVQSFSQGCAEPSGDEGVSVFGFFQPQADYKFLDEPESTFRFNRMRMGVMGSIPYDFSYYSQLEMSSFANAEGKVHLLDAFISYTRFKNFKISIGSFKKPLGAELSLPCSGLYTIERTEFVNELTGPSNRDMGVMILGGADSTMLSYRLAFMNGTGVGVSDNNRFKDIYGRLIFQPVYGLKIGLNAMYGEDPNATDAAKTDKRIRMGADIGWQYNNLLINGEYMLGDDRGTYTTGGGCDGTPVEVHEGSLKRGGFYFLAAYRLLYNWMPVIRYEQYDKDLGVDGIDKQTITYGLNYYFNDWTRVQINYKYSAEDPLEIKNDALLFQIQVKF